MFFSLIQTLVCVLLIQGSLYALHLSGGGSSNSNAGIGGSGGSGGGGGGGITNQNNPNLNKANIVNPSNHYQLPPASSQSLNMPQQREQQLREQQQREQQQHQYQQQQQQAQHYQAHQQQQQQHAQPHHMYDMLAAANGLLHHQPAAAGAGVGTGSSHLSPRMSAHMPQQHMSVHMPTHMNHLNKQQMADIAQIERERFMLASMAKEANQHASNQASINAAMAAAAAGNGATTVHGRPIISGRIQMGPASDQENDYAQLMQHAYKFGVVVKQPKPSPEYEDDDDYRDGAAYQGQRSRPAKYEYGRVVQPDDRERERLRELELERERERESAFDLESLDFDDFKELESDDDELADLEGYKYLEELAEQENKADDELDDLEHNFMLDDAPHHTFEELFEEEQREEQALKKQQQQQQQQHAQHQPKFYADAFGASGQPRSSYNIRLQQKWARKRAQLASQQQPEAHLQRNIFGHKQPHSLFGKSSSTEAAQGNKAFAAKTKTGVALTPSEAVASNDNEHSESTAAQSQSSSAQSKINDKVNVATASNILNKLNEKDKETEPEKLLPNHKRSGNLMPGSSANNSPFSAVSHSVANQLMLRTARGQRQYDVPQIECPTAVDGMERFACPTPDVQGRYRCIDDHVLCDGFIDCPEGEDEDRKSCMFYKTTKAHLDVLADALLRWARGR